MESNFVQFNETDLKQVIFSAALLATLEQSCSERDWDIIESFAGGYWQPEFGEYSQFQKRIFNEISCLLEDEISLYETIDSLLTDFGIRFSQDQKNIILGLMGYLFATEGIPEIDAPNLFATFLNRLGPDQPGLT